MRKSREVLRLRFAQCLSERDIASSLGISRSTVQGCLQRARATRLTWPLPDELTDVQLDTLLYPVKKAVVVLPLPDYAAVHRELKRKGVTRYLLWQEYQAQHPTGLRYTAFCVHYQHWLKSVDPVMRFEHHAGDKLFVDYAGHTIEVIDRYSGELRTAQIFVAVLGCSNYTYVEATWSQMLPDWLGSHVRALNFFGGTPAAIVPDNLKSGVSKAHRYDPELNPAYAEFAAHYDVSILPTRVRKPRDKAKVEGGVLIVERWILARLRNQSFFSLAELNAAIQVLLTELNARPFKKLDGSRHSRFVEIEQSALKPLPSRAYEYAQWKCAKVHLDYHLEVERAYYSVPYQHIGDRVDVRISAHRVEVFKDRQLIASHARAVKRGERKTLDAHRPVAHRAVINQSITRLLEHAAHIGSATTQVLRTQFDRKVHPEMALRAAQGILRMAQDFTPEKLEAACERAVQLQLFGYRAIRSLLTTPREVTEPVQASLLHDNLRGPDYFH
jgi:transposase